MDQTKLHPAAEPFDLFAKWFAVATEKEPNALLVPDTALGADQGGRYLLVVDKDNVVAQRHVEVGPLVDTLRVIQKGIGAEDRVVVDGIQRAIPGAKVEPVVQTASAKN